MEQFYAEHAQAARAAREAEARAAEDTLSQRWREHIQKSAEHGMPPSAVCMHVETCPSRRTLNSLQTDDIKLVTHEETSRLNFTCMNAEKDWDGGGGFMIRAVRPGVLGFWDRWYDVSTRQ